MSDTPTCKAYEPFKHYPYGSSPRTDCGNTADESGYCPTHKPPKSERERPDIVLADGTAIYFKTAADYREALWAEEFRPFKDDNDHYPMRFTHP